MKESIDTFKSRLKQLPQSTTIWARGIEANDEHSAIVESHSFNSYVETKAFAYMASTIEEVVKKFEE